MNHADLLKTHSLIERDNEESLVEACNYVLALSDAHERVKTYQEAYVGIYGLFQGLLDSEQYVEAALLAWGVRLFDPRPRSVKRIWDGLMNYPKILIPGGEAQGKSYTPSAWADLNWVRDPAYTSGKILSVTASHAAANVMATIKSFHENAAFKFPGRVMDQGIDLGNGDRRASIALVALPPGDDGKGRLRGFHQVPRPFKHPQFGWKSRLFALVDEGEDGSGGLFEGLDNLASTQTRKKPILITIASGANPKKPESPYAQRAAYPGGQEKFSLDESEEWDGPAKLGKWRVIRLDPAKSENVVERREVYPGMMIHERFEELRSKGSNSPEYMTFARGAWPQGGSEFYITPRSYFNDAIGIYTFDGMPTPVATLDPAFAEGGDSPIMTAGRYGRVIGFTPFGGDYVQFPKTFNGLQIEQQFEIKKDNTLIMAKEVMNYLKALQVRPEWFAIDTTGNALGLHDALKLQFGDILGVQWSEKATDKRILQEDTQTAEERYSGVVTEMAFAFSIWLQYGYIKIAPMMDATKLISQVSGRKYFYDGRGLMRAQSKADYKSDTGGQSPDEGDSAWMMPHLIRIRQSQNAAMLPDVVRDQKKKMMVSRFPTSPVNKMEAYDIS